ncbi:hypothetical protein BGZ58_003237, partial [Dissophora ornata]
MHDPQVFYGVDLLEQIRAECVQADFSDCSKVAGLSEVVMELKAASAEVTGEDGVVDLKRLSEKMIQLMAEKTEAHMSIRKAVFSAVHFMALRRPSVSMSESKVVSVWEFVLSCFTDHALNFETGELVSKASKHRCEILGEELNTDTTTSAYGKKVDLQLRVEDELELNNSEYKRCSTSQQKLDLQFRKNILINHSMMLYLEEMIGWSWDDFHLLAMDVHGWTATIFCLKRVGDVFVCDLVTDHAPVLPHCNTSWNDFLSGTGETIAALWNYSKYMERYAKAVRARRFKHAQEKATAYRRSTTSQPRSLGQFTIFSPTKSRSIIEMSSQSSCSEQ